MINTLDLKDYLTLCKPRVVLLMLVTAWVGMHLASPDQIPWRAFIFGSIGIALAASSAAIINHLIDRNIDAKMSRTALRPIASGRISPQKAFYFSLLLGFTALFILMYFINFTTTLLTFATLIGYAIFYTIYLKRATPQNIVIGGAAGAMPPVLGWAAVSGDINPYGLLLVLIIFVWTPPHFWALAIYRENDYAKAGIPMLPNTHGVKFTKLSILLYTILLIPCTLLPYLVRMSGVPYLISAMLLNALFLYQVIVLYRSNDNKEAIRTFQLSIMYLLLIFIALLFDHYCQLVIYYPLGVTS